MHESIAWLYGLQHFGIKLGLGNIRALLGLLGLPDRSCRFLHVAGTNGKGSVSAMVDAMLSASGVRSGLFTSPHLVRPNERIRIAGEDVADAELYAQLETLRAVIERAVAERRLGAHPSFFEVMTAAALACFARHRLPAAVLEVGLGGRLDATNAVDAPVGVVVGVGLDHTNVLGSTIEEIAGEKAGIVKPGMLLVSGVVQQRAVDVLRRACCSRGATLVDARSEVELVGEAPAGFTVRTGRGVYEDLRLALAGRHQIDNARVAIAAFERFADTLGLAPRPEAVRAGLAAVRWPGRLEWLRPDDGGAGILVDGAHNRDGMQALAEHLAREGGRPPVLLFGATAGRPLEDLLAPLAGRVEAAVVTRPPVDRAVDPESVVRAARSTLGPIEIVADCTLALARARQIAGAEGWVLAAGSLYLVGAVLAALGRGKGPGPVPM